MDTYSISVRLRRVTTEDGFVSVPVTQAVMQAHAEPDGTQRLDAEKVFAEAVRLGVELPDWNTEELQVSVHPIQQAPDEA
jgi:hypothetical protein